MADTNSMRYIAENQRDLRIDMLRGIVLVMMVVAHTEILSVLNILTWERFGLTTGAEGFVILSGFMIGYIKRKQLQTQAMLTVAYSLFRRALTIYIVNIFIILSILALSNLDIINTFDVTHFTDRFSNTSYAMFPVNEQIRETWFNNVIFLQIGPHQTQVLGLYFYFMLISPIFLWLLATKRTFFLLLLSFAGYLFYQFTKLRLTSAIFEFAFPILAWQLIYVLGICCGWFKEELLSWAKSKAGHIVIYFMVIFAVVMMFIAQNHTNPFMPPSLVMHVIPAKTFNYIYQNFAGKNSLGILRIINDFCLIVAMYILLTYCWRPINRAFGWFFIVLGQNSLYVFILHVYVVLIISQLVTFDLRQYNWLFNTLIHLGALMALWLMARYGVMKRIIPN